MTQTQHPHSRAEWDGVKDFVEELYLIKNMTLEQVRAEAKNVLGFEATSRQYKTKLKTWDFDDKKIKGDLWMAMAVVMRNQPRSTSAVQFNVPIRGNWIRKVNADAINKQMRRSKEMEQSLAEAWAKLQMKGIEISTREVTKEDLARVNAHQSTTFDTSDGDVMQILPTSYPDMLPPIRTLENPGVSSGRTMGTHMTALSAEMIHRARVVQQLPPIQSLISSIHPDNLENHSAQQLWPEINESNKRSTGERFDFAESILDHDVVSSLSMLSVHESCDEGTVQVLRRAIGRSPRVLATPLDDEKILASRWTAYYILKALAHNDESVGQQNRRRFAAIGAFRTMLDNHNPFIFSYCHWIIAVLVSNEKMEVLLDFLTDCCETIDHHPVYRESNYASHFHFTLASYRGDQRSVEQHSQTIERNQDAVGLISGYRSPNYLINQYNLAWHKLNEKRYNEALGIMSQYLPISQQIMGPTHMVTITCLAMLSRAHTEMNNITSAILCLEDALGRLVNSAGILLAYKYRLLRRLAVLQIQMNNVQPAEDHLLEIIHFRIRHFGIVSDSTWNAIIPLVELLKSQGRREDSESLSSNMVRMHDQALQRQHLKDHDAHAPWVCDLCYRPRDSLNCCTGTSLGNPRL